MSEASVLAKIAYNVVDERVKLTALISILEEKGLITKEEFEKKYNEISISSKEKFSAELLGIAEEQFIEYNK
ncbi:MULTISPECIES: hypothetical protein [unclassified Sutcliffiella]|uniref:hypothetical protein n=1 Tax=unclassified Sutcliffiella TaxID=2837532 RepID=UPI0030CDF610